MVVDGVLEFENFFPFTSHRDFAGQVTTSNGGSNFLQCFEPGP